MQKTRPDIVAQGYRATVGDRVRPGVSVGTFHAVGGRILLQSSSVGHLPAHRTRGLLAPAVLSRGLGPRRASPVSQVALVQIPALPYMVFLGAPPAAWA